MNWKFTGLLLLFCLPLWIGLDDSTIWDSNEAFYTETPREMLNSGDWLVPHFNGKPRLNKPPLSYWIVALCYRLGEVSILWERIPMAALASGSLLLVFLLGRRLFDQPVGIWGAALLATSFRFVVLSRRLMIDTLLLFCLLAAAYFFVRWIQSGRSGAFLSSWVFLALGFLTKGPVTLIPLLPFAFFTLQRRRALLRQAPWVSGLCLFVLLASSWYVLLGWREGWNAVFDFFLTENVGRLLSADFGPSRGLFYYVGVFFADFFPWSLLFPAAVFWWLRGRRLEELKNWKDSMLFLTFWMVVFLLIFSLSRNKQEYYILPVYPAAALWIGAYLRKGRLLLPVRGLPAILLLVLAVLTGLTAQALFSQSPTMWIPSCFLLAAAVVLLLLSDYRAAAVLLSGFYASAMGLYLEPLEQYKPVYPLALEIQDMTADLDPSQRFQAGYYRLTAPSLRFYLEQDILELYEKQEAREALKLNTLTLLIMSEEDYRETRADFPGFLRIVARRPKLYTTARTFIEVLKRGRIDNLIDNLRENWVRDVYLVSNREGG